MLSNTQSLEAGVYFCQYCQAFGIISGEQSGISSLVKLFLVRQKQKQDWVML